MTYVVTQVHLSFSLYGSGDGNASPQLQWKFLRLFLDSVGIVLTDIDDVIFKSVLPVVFCRYFPTTRQSLCCIFMHFYSF